MVPPYYNNLTHTVPFLFGLKTKQQLKLKNKAFLGIISNLH